MHLLTICFYNQKMPIEKIINFFSRFESSLVGAALENVFSRGHAVLPFFVPSLESGGSLSESGRVVEQAELKGTRELRPDEIATAERDRPAGPQTAPDSPPPPRAKVRQLQRPRKRPRRCDVCEKDFKSIGKMQAHRYV